MTDDQHLPSAGADARDARRPETVQHEDKADTRGGTPEMLGDLQSSASQPEVATAPAPNDFNYYGKSYDNSRGEPEAEPEAVLNVAPTDKPAVARTVTRYTPYVNNAHQLCLRPSGPNDWSMVDYTEVAPILTALAEREQEIADLKWRVEDITGQWSIMARHCGNWRDFGQALAPDVLARRKLIEDNDFAVAVRAIMERDHLAAAAAGAAARPEEIAETNEGEDARVDGVPTVGRGDLPRDNRHEVISAPAPNTGEVVRIIETLVPHQWCWRERGHPCGSGTQRKCHGCGAFSRTIGLISPVEVTDAQVDGAFCEQCWPQRQLHRCRCCDLIVAILPKVVPSDGVDQALTALSFAEGAIIDAIGLEDGLDGGAGHAVLQMIRAALLANGRAPIPIPPEDQPGDPPYQTTEQRLAAAALDAAPRDEKVQEDKEASRVDGVPGVGQGDLPRKDRHELIRAPMHDLLRILQDAWEIRSACGFMWMRMAVAKDAQDAYDVAKRELADHAAAFNRLETALPNAIEHLAAAAAGDAARWEKEATDAGSPVDCARTVDDGREAGPGAIRTGGDAAPADRPTHPRPWTATFNAKFGAAIWWCGRPMFRVMAGADDARVTADDPVPQWQKCIDAVLSLNDHAAAAGAAARPEENLTITATADEREQVEHAADLRGQTAEEYIKIAINAALRKQGVDAVLFRESDDE